MKHRYFSVARLLIGLSASLLLQAAQALDVQVGDFERIRTHVTDKTLVWQYVDNPSIYLFDFPGLTLQGRTFNRITQFTEQQTSEPYPKVLNNAELDRYIEAARRTQADFAFGHDVLISELVQFFNYAQRDQVALNPEEIELRDFLVEKGMVRQWRGFYQALQPNVVILSVPQTQEQKVSEPKVSDGARYTILLHEMAHAEYYTNSYYAKYCQKFWYETLTQEQRDLFTRFLQKKGYGVGFDGLLINETQAYLMFTPDHRSFSAERLGVTAQELAEIRSEFMRGRPPTRLPFAIPGGVS